MAATVTPARRGLIVHRGDAEIELTYDEARDIMIRMGLIIEPEYPADVLGPQLLDRLRRDYDAAKHHAEAGPHD